MTVTIEPYLRALLSEEDFAEIATTLARGVSCCLCSQPVQGEGEEGACLIALRDTERGQAVLRFTHPRCGPSQIIDVDRLPEPAAPAAPTAGTEWALSIRDSAPPTVVLAWDLEHVSEIPVHGLVLRESLRLDGLMSGEPIDLIAPPQTHAIGVHRHEALLFISTPHGTERLALADLNLAAGPLRIAARQRRLLLVTGLGLGLDSGHLTIADHALCTGEAFAAVVPYSDPELLAWRPGRKNLRSLARGILSLTPSARRRARLADVVASQLTGA